MCLAYLFVPKSMGSKASPISPGSLPMTPSVAPSHPGNPLYSQSPQHFTLLFCSLAQALYTPMKISTGVCPVPRFTAGQLSPMSLISFPMSPVTLPSLARVSSTADPQHFNTLLSKMAHPEYRPSAIFVTLLPVPKLIAGKLAPILPTVVPLLLVDPIPSSPFMLAPQHFTELSDRWAHAKLNPA
jgi:hypothetical protein